MQLVSTLACQARGRGFESRRLRQLVWSGAGIAQLVEHRTENPGVPSSSLGPGTRGSEATAGKVVALARDSGLVRAFRSPLLRARGAAPSEKLLRHHALITANEMQVVVLLDEVEQVG